MPPRNDIAPPLPQNLEAERAVLGAVLLDDHAMSVAIERLRPEDFFLEEHRRIFRAMLRISEKRQAIDAITLREDLTHAGELEAAGGSAYISAIPDGLPRISNTRRYAEIVASKAVLRRLIHTAAAIEEAAFDRAAVAVDLQARAVREFQGIALQNGAAGSLGLPFENGAEVSTDDADVTWVLPGYVAAGAITELSGKVKAAGKTTFALHLARAVLDGGEFLGSRCLRGPVVYLTEQPGASFAAAMRKAGLIGRAGFNFLRWHGVRQLEWERVGEAVVEFCKRVGAVLLIVDTLGQWSGLSGDAENEAGSGLTAVRPLQLAAGAGLAVLLVRHERKSGGELGDSGRGSSAITGAVDIVLSLRRPEGNATENRRTLHAVSRFDETPTEPQVIELRPDGYALRGSRKDFATGEARRAILEAAPTCEGEAIEKSQLLATLELSGPTAQRAINGLVRDGLLDRVGAGRKGSPFRYFLPPDSFSLSKKGM